MYFPNLKQVLEEHNDSRVREDYSRIKGVLVIIPDRNELPENAVGTVKYSLVANLLAKQEYGVKGRVIDAVYLSDQSGEDIANANKNALEQCVKEMRTKFFLQGCEELFPEVGYIKMDKGLNERILNSLKGVRKLDLLKNHLREKGIYGKGLNMYLATLLIDSIKGDGNSALLSLDADYRNRSAEQILAQALPLSHMGYDSVTGTFHRYHQTASGKMEMGGRVNAATRAIFDMLSEASLMKEMGYPLCGDQGAVLSVLRNLKWPMQFGIETAWRIQFHSRVNAFSKGLEPLLHKRDSLQVDIGGNDDVPIAEGKPYKEVLESISEMSGQVAEAALACIDSKILKERWESHKKFMENFIRLQKRSFRIWEQNCIEDYGEVLPICGGIIKWELEKVTIEKINKIVGRFYRHEKEGQRLRAQFLPSLNELRKLQSLNYKSFGKILASGLTEF